MLEALPNIDWSAEEVIPALNQILKRINTIFTKITDKPDLMVRLSMIVLEQYLSVITLNGLRNTKKYILIIKIVYAVIKPCISYAFPNLNRVKYILR